MKLNFIRFFKNEPMLAIGAFALPTKEAAVRQLQAGGALGAVDCYRHGRSESRKSVLKTQLKTAQVRTCDNNP